MAPYPSCGCSPTAEKCGIIGGARFANKGIPLFPSSRCVVWGRIRSTLGQAEGTAWAVLDMKHDLE